MTAIVIFQSTIKDAQKFSNYASLVPPTLKPFNGEVIARGKREKVLAGDNEHPTIGVIRFPSLEAAHEWYESEAYQALIPERDLAAKLAIETFQEPQ